MKKKNIDRSARGMYAVRQNATAFGYDTIEPLEEENFIDTITDILHAATTLKIDADTILRISRTHWEVEK
jgi:hypothetical protein